MNKLTEGATATENLLLPLRVQLKTKLVGISKYNTKHSNRNKY